MERAILSIAELKLFVASERSVALRFASESESSAPSATTITMLKIATDTSISIRVNPLVFIMAVSLAPERLFAPVL
jgi:hypothetical protein